MQLQLLYDYAWGDRRMVQPALAKSLPFVTIQLPIYNELYVVERLLDNIARLEYPMECFEVDVLDDSTDETTEIVHRKIEALRARGLQFRHIRRSVRSGYKAGALKDALQVARGEFIAIFDADFLPKPNFLEQVLPWFSNEQTGVVQTRWEHLNESYSVLTRLQALMLNVHFRVEQQGRQTGGYLGQFNGTGGIWRRSAIVAAGGWQTDTLTEDLDLSVRAQIKGWRIVYLEEVTCPAELPAEMNGLKSQQFRWMKGGAETARKILVPLWKSDLTRKQKGGATLYLLASTVFPLVFLFTVSSVPAIYLPGEWSVREYLPMLGLAALIPFVAVQYVSNVQVVARNGGRRRLLGRFLILLPLFLAFSMGLALHNTVAVVEGWLGKRTEFVRTPKFNLTRPNDTFAMSRYLATRVSWVTLMEGLLALYFLGAVLYGVSQGTLQPLVFYALPLHVMLLIGYSAVFVYSFAHLRRPRRNENFYRHNEADDLMQH